MKTIGRLSAVCLSLLMLVALAVDVYAAGGAESKTVTVLTHASWLLAGPQAAFDLAQKELGITFDFIKAPEGAPGEQVIQSRMATGDLPDILWWQNTLYAKPRLGGEKFADQFVDLSGMAWTDSYDKDMLASPAYTQKGKLVEAPCPFGKDA
jgi:raffinose/stachyose/melibiose transport system substrate-binding protein